GIISPQAASARPEATVAASFSSRILSIVAQRRFELPHRYLLGLQCLLGLLDNHAAGDAIARVAGRIVGEVVRLGVNDQGRTALVEKRIRAFAYRGAYRGEGEFAGSLL